MLTGNKAAKWFIFHNPELVSGYIDENTRINKLLYFSNLLYYCVNKRNLISDDFIAFPNGPVIFSVYSDYRYNGLDTLPSSSPEIASEEEQFLNIIDFVYGNYSTHEMIEESHTQSPWRNVRHLIPSNPKIDFSAADASLIAYYQSLYQTYAGMDFTRIAKEKINGNIYYYSKDAFEMTDPIIEQLSSFARCSEPMFLELINGELVVS